MNKKQESITHSRLGIIVVFSFSFTCFICPMKHLRDERISGSETQWTKELRKKEFYYISIFKLSVQLIQFKLCFVILLEFNYYH